VEILRFGSGVAERIGRRPYDVKLASSIEVAEGEGEAHAYVLYFEPGASSATRGGLWPDLPRPCWQWLGCGR
jgi:hypothetical protein